MSVLSQSSSDRKMKHQLRKIQILPLILLSLRTVRVIFELSKVHINIVCPPNFQLRLTKFCAIVEGKSGVGTQKVGVQVELGPRYPEELNIPGEWVRIFFIPQTFLFSVRS